MRLEDMETQDLEETECCDRQCELVRLRGLDHLTEETRWRRDEELKETAW